LLHPPYVLIFPSASCSQTTSACFSRNKRYQDPVPECRTYAVFCKAHFLDMVMLASHPAPLLCSSYLSHPQFEDTQCRGDRGLT